MFINFVCWLLKRKKLTTLQRQQLINQVLASVDALPLHSIITVNGADVSIRGVPLNAEQSVALRDSADQALHNRALQIVHEQVLYQAVSLGVHQAQNTEQIQFAKAAIWYGQEEQRILKALSSNDPRELLA